MTARMSVRRLPPPGLAGGNEWFDKCPLVIRQVARVSQMITIVFRAVLMRPHRGPSSNQAASLESQMIQGIQQVLGRTLSPAGIMLSEFGPVSQ